MVFLKAIPGIVPYVYRVCVVCNFTINNNLFYTSTEFTSRLIARTSGVTLHENAMFTPDTGMSKELTAIVAR